MHLNLFAFIIIVLFTFQRVCLRFLAINLKLILIELLSSVKTVKFDNPPVETTSNVNQIY